MTMTENDLAALCQAQSEELAKCQEEISEARSQRDMLADEVIARHETYIPTEEEVSALQSQMCRPHIERWKGAEKEICELQQDKVTVCRQRNDAHEVIRDLLGAIELYRARTSLVAPHILDPNLTATKIAATKLLARYTTEEG